jgi:hypothetical protein
MKRVLIQSALAACFATSTLSAQVWNKKTKVTFSAPVQIPGPSAQNGVVTLPAGSYVFALADSASERHIVQVKNPREDRVFSTILAISDYRINASSKTVMYFSERKAGAPMAIKSWFYPGDNYGLRFVYPKVKATEIAAVTNQPVPSHTVEVVEKVKYVEVPVYIQTPAKQEVAYAPKTFEKTDATDTAGVDGEPVKTPEPAPAAPAAAPAPLPKTASPLELAGILGLLLLVAAFAFRRAAAHLR